MLILFSAIASVIPMSFYLYLIWKFDRYDREPFKFVLVNYLWGALGAILFALVGSIIITGLISFFLRDKELLSHFGAVLVAPFIEEITKGFFLLITISSKKFDNITDGIVYGGAIGLGFGMTENFLYFLAFRESVAEWLMLVIIRSLFSAVMHCVSTATLGVFLALGKFKSGTMKLILSFSGFIFAMIIHAIWNFTVSFERTAPIGFVFMIFSIILFFIIYNTSIKRERILIYNELKDETGLIPESHLDILSSPKREQKGWLDEGLRKTYIKAATSLAFRKMQHRNANGASKTYYQMDIDNYRNFIVSLLSNSQKK